MLSLPLVFPGVRIVIVMSYYEAWYLRITIIGLEFPVHSVTVSFNKEFL